MHFYCRKEYYLSTGLWHKWLTKYMDIQNTSLSLHIMLLYMHDCKPVLIPGHTDTIFATDYNGLPWSCRDKFLQEWSWKMKLEPTELIWGTNWYESQQLTHWGRVTHICVGQLIIICSDNGLSPRRHQAIIWTNAGILLIRPSEQNFSQILFRNQIFSFKKMHLKMSSAKWRSFVSAWTS